jgi:hypothetical protein
MIRFVADENFDDNILDALRGRPELFDLVRVQDVGLRALSDPAILAWAAEQARIVLTHDKKTMPGFAFDRVRNGQAMPGVIIAAQSLGIGRTVVDLVLIGACGRPEDFKDQVTFLPI